MSLKSLEVPLPINKEATKEHSRLRAKDSWNRLCEGLQTATLTPPDFLKETRSIIDNMSSLPFSDQRQINKGFAGLRKHEKEIIQNHIKPFLLREIASHTNKTDRKQDQKVAEMLGLVGNGFGFGADKDVSQAMGADSPAKRRQLQATAGIIASTFLLGATGQGAMKHSEKTTTSQRVEKQTPPLLNAPKPEIPVAPKPSPSPEASNTLENKESLASQRSEIIGFKVNSVEAINALPPSVGIIRIDGDSNLMYEDGRFHHNPDHYTEEMLAAADKKGLKVVFAYKASWFPGVNHGFLQDGDLEKSHHILGNHMQSVLKHPSVQYFEVGNEIDHNDPAAPDHFWAGNMQDYAKLFKMAVDNVREINLGRKTPAELIISSFADPMGKFNSNAKDTFAALVSSLKSNGVNPQEFLVAGHAYHYEILKWIIENLQSTTNTKGVIITEFNASGTKDSDPKELADMIKLLEASQVISLAHEYKPEKKETANPYALDKDDDRFKVIMAAVTREIAKKQLDNQENAKLQKN